MSGYIGPIPVPQGIQNKETFTATAGQTTFNTNGYTDGAFINVYLNGVRLINGTDYTATNGSDIVLTQAASVSDVLDFETFNEFSLASQQFENITLKNPTHEDTDGGRESAVSFKGEQSGGEISTLAQIQASHDGTSDDQKGDLIFKTNDGSDNNAPTERMRIDSAGATTITVTGNEDTLSLVSTDADASAGPNLNLYRNSGSPADNDFLGNIKFNGRNDNSQDVLYAEVEAYALDVSDGTEDGLYNVNVITGGTNQSYMQLKAGSGVVFNEDGQDIDFRVESDDNANMLFVDAGNNEVGIGTNSPVSILEAKRMTTASGIHTIQTLSTVSAGYGYGPALDFAVDWGGYITTAKIASPNVSGGNGYGGELRFSTNGTSINTMTERMRIHNNGNTKFGENLGTKLADCPVQIERNESNNDSCIRTKNPSLNTRFHLDFHNSNGTQGNITCQSSSVTFNSTSDYRKKENVNYTWDGITDVKLLKPAKFNFIGESNTVQGFLAHEVSDIVPLAVTGTHNQVEVWREGEELPDGVSVGDNKLDGDGNTIPVYQSMDASKLVPLLTKALQEAITKIETLETEMTSVKSRLDALEAE